MAKNGTIQDALQGYINSLSMNSDYLYSESKFHSDVDEISTFLELTYGLDKKQKFLSFIVENDSEYKISMGRMKAYLFSLQSRGFQDFPASKNKNIVKSRKNSKSSDHSNAVFVVHGHDDEVKESVARFISNLGLEPIILHERPNSGKTIIEKLESNADDISFAVVLLTPDDRVAPVESDEYKYRARQNVIYELGFFNAKLGRDKVCVLKKGDIEVLSDYLGVVYVDMDKNGGWKNKLAREFKEAGLLISSDNLEKALLT